MADISKVVRAKVASRMRGAPVMDLATIDKESEEEPTPIPKRKTLKLGKIRTADSSVLHKVVWPHKVVYTATGKPAEYDDISIPLFISRYLTVMAMEKPSVCLLMAQHLQDLTGDTVLYEWEHAMTFHTIWLRQLEQGRVTWVDEDAKVKFRWALV